LCEEFEYPEERKKRPRGQVCAYGWLRKKGKRREREKRGLRGRRVSQSMVEGGGFGMSALPVQKSRTPCSNGRVENLRKRREWKRHLMLTPHGESQKKKKGEKRE